jgi:hypothetical protein
MWVLMLSVVLGIGLQGMCEQGKSIPLERVIPTMETSLQQLAVEARRAVPQAEALASLLGIGWEGGRVCVVIETDGSLSASAVARLGGEVLLRADAFHLLKVEISATRLLDLASLPGVKYVRTPYHPVPLILSEGVELSGASAWQQEGYGGQGIRVAVIDGGFEGLTAALSAGELAHVVFTSDYTGDGLETGGVHGTACAEIVHDMAPTAELLLMKIDTDVDLANAVSDAISQGVDVITHSMGWFNTNFYDGTGIIADSVAQAVNNGILWVNSAGNSATAGHWEGAWQDTDGDGWLDFASGDEENALYLESGQTIGLLFTWDAWPATNQDYDLYLVDEWGNIVAGSTSYQSGTQEPAEAIFYTALTAGNYGIKVEAYDAPAHPGMELFCFYYGSPLEYDTSISTITAPANAPFVLTVGAIDWHNWETGPQESFSSQGPTNSSQYAASIIKPDICGADAVSGMSYGSSFKGTSASCPHAAGAAALIWSRYPYWGATDVRDWLESNAVDMGAWGKDNIYGHGRLSLPFSSDPAGKSHTYGTAAGWYMVSVPLNSGSPSSLFGTTAYTYNPTTGAYDVASTIEPAKGYWVYLPANKAVTDAGDQVTSDVTLDISTAGWWQISAPWNYPKDAIQVTWTCNSCGGSRKMTKSWADAVAADWVRDDIYGYKAPDGDYNTPSTLDPWYGYWVKAKISGLSLTLLSAMGTPVSMTYAPMAAPPLAASPLAFAPTDLPPMPLGAMGGPLVFPNPILPSHEILMNPLSFYSPAQEAVEAIRVQIFDLAGRLVYEHEEDGSSMEWHTENDYGESLANGIYLYKLYIRVDGVWIATEVKKLVILR